MKKLLNLTRVLALCFGVFLATGAVAQQGNRPQGQGQMSMQDRNAQMLKDYKEQLNLTAEQETKIQAILTSAAEEQQALRNQNATRDELMEKRRALMTKSQTEIKAVLTPEQAKQFDTMVANQQQRMRNGQGQRPSRSN
ncbi:hypothetical protein FVR03_09555 [Pontibacter qinzhouensis]|uniref:Periplasmic heavy metal sensor n=1 Tax=Pontibacter qinzhouensis TaxID=2603253 RepID=A0A5C8K6I1_9BACT|nr:hypothetical protein [Pontibacter qinzhouensis]TXK47432.1 hypothetical protein FVR03_09555 [Pontibacter qinzhouensis]